MATYAELLLKLDIESYVRFYNLFTNLAKHHDYMILTNVPHVTFKALLLITHMTSSICKTSKIKATRLYTFTTCVTAKSCVMGGNIKTHFTVQWLFLDRV